ncbi:MAG: extensin family protein [Minicystis sp.]
MARLHFIAAVGILTAASVVSIAAGPAAADPPKEPPYPLDSLAREAPEGDLRCPEVELENYRGDVVRYKPAVWVYTGFRPRLAAFEKVVRDVGIEVYGRAPERIVELGGYGCRRMREHAGWLSEHALGNAIDIAGFEFGHIAKGATLPPGLDKAFVNGFEVKVLSHWGKKTGHAAVHARFLRTLAARLIARDDVFRVLLGPGYPGHNNHFHFDMSPFRMVQIFEDGKLLAAPAKAP